MLFVNNFFIDCCYHTTVLLFAIGVRDRNRTCIKRICNPSPNRSVAHAHKSGTLAQIRTERISPFERDDFTILSTRASCLAESQGVEPCGQLSSPYGLAIRCLTIRPTLLTSSVRFHYGNQPHHLLL